MKSTSVIMFGCTKGGVGKTTSSIEVGACAAAEGKKVLFIDMDPQGNLSRVLLGKVPISTEKTVFDFLTDENINFKEVIRKASPNFKNCSVIPANHRLDSIDKWLENDPVWINKLKEPLERIYHNFDLVIIDTAPRASKLIQMSLRAANKLFIPTDLSILSEDGIEAILGVTEFLKDKLNHKLDEIKIFITANHKGGANVNREAVRSLKEKYGKMFLNINLPHSVKVTEAQRLHNPPKSILDITDAEHALIIGYKTLTTHVTSHKGA